MATEDIYNYRKLNDQLSTAGQPTSAQLQSVAADGFQAVINLATYNPEHSLKDEAGLVQSLGMIYHHIPVDWQNPQESDFAAFETTLQALAGKKILIHCAANYRVTAFYGLYAMKHLGWTEAQADALRVPIWGNALYPAWETFIQAMKAKIA
ncbi:MAG: hypothetical protein Fur0022_17200 [Anaerolineales bacterium]